MMCTCTVGLSGSVPLLLRCTFCQGEQTCDFLFVSLDDKAFL